ncbi:hypothetical protein GF357_01940, partial [Candidatus Dojkabacteria bacterium]|nr:hypothetical protein [Candidatus Dojkabacteria bacterium]
MIGFRNKTEIFMVTKQQKVIDLIEKFGIVFFWLRWFYPEAEGIKYAYLGYYFFPQKILRINGSIPWPMHFTSRIISAKKVKVGEGSAPGMSSGCYIQAKNGIEIGDNVRIGPNVGLISADHDQSNYDVWIEEKPLKIGNNVWIGM